MYLRFDGQTLSFWIPDISFAIKKTVMTVQVPFNDLQVQFLLCRRQGVFRKMSVRCLNLCDEIRCCSGREEREGKREPW